MKSVSHFFQRLSHQLSLDVKSFTDPKLDLGNFSKIYFFIDAIFQNFKLAICQIISISLLVALTNLATIMITTSMLSLLPDIHLLNDKLLLISLVFGFISSIVLGFLNEWQIKSVNTYILAWLLPKIWQHIIYLPIKTANKYISGEIIQRFLDYEALATVLLPTVLSMILNGISLVLLLLYLSYKNVWLGISFFMICMIFTGVKYWLANQNNHHINGQLIHQTQINTLLNEILLQITKVRSTHSEQRFFQQWLKGIVKMKLHTEQFVKNNILSKTIDSIIPMVLLMCCYLNLYTSTQKETVVLLEFILCGTQLTSILQLFTTDIISLTQLLPGLKRMQTIFSESLEQYDQPKPTVQLKGDIVFSQVSFNHPESHKKILENISLEVKPGQFIGIIGPSGAGKSTLLKLLLGFEAISSGRIFIDLQPISTYHLSSLRQLFGVVLQSTTLLPGTILANLAANSPLSLEDAWRLARYVGLDEEINNMPMKMHTYISDNSEESISGGQKQKLLIARALATRPKILLLDEATSALDNTSQLHIYNNLQELNITRVVIAHRYSTLVDADKIYVLDQGRIIDAGTYGELLTRQHIIT